MMTCNFPVDRRRTAVADILIIVVEPGEKVGGDQPAWQERFRGP